jgi:hypothetical protein
MLWLPVLAFSLIKGIRFKKEVFFFILLIPFSAPLLVCGIIYLVLFCFGIRSKWVENYLSLSFPFLFGPSVYAYVVGDFVRDLFFLLGQFHYGKINISFDPLLFFLLFFVFFGCFFVWEVGLFLSKLRKVKNGKSKGSPDISFSEFSDFSNLGFSNVVYFVMGLLVLLASIYNNPAFPSADWAFSKWFFF